jgi:hypothetical protein
MAGIGDTERWTKLLMIVLIKRSIAHDSAGLDRILLGHVKLTRPVRFNDYVQFPLTFAQSLLLKPALLSPRAPIDLCVM